MYVKGFVLYSMRFRLNGFCVAWSGEDPAAIGLSRHGGILCPDSEGTSYHPG